MQRELRPAVTGNEHCNLNHHRMLLNAEVEQVEKTAHRFLLQVLQLIKIIPVEHRTLPVTKEPCSTRMLYKVLSKEGYGCLERTGPSRYYFAAAPRHLRLLGSSHSKTYGDGSR